MTAALDITETKDGGVLKEVLTPGTGSESPPSGSKVSVHYEGKFQDGKIFDSSVARGEQFTFTLGEGQVIKGWDIAVATMKKDEKCRITCKPEYAYGKTGSPPKIPADSTLVFDITLYSWKEEDLTEDNSGVFRSTIVKGDGYASPVEFRLCKVELKGTYDGRVFDERIVEFSLCEEGKALAIPPGVELALTKMKKGEKSRLTLLPKHGWPEGNLIFLIKPGSTIQYEITLLEFEKDLEAWDMDAAQKIEQAVFLKNKATQYFQKAEYKIAEKLYLKAASYIDSNQGYSEEEETERKKVLLAIKLNMSLVYLKLEASHEAKTECDKVLEMDENNVKGLFRRGQALLLMNEPQAAKEDFEKLLKIEPSNKAAASQVSVCRQKMKILREKEKKIYSNMFDKFARKDEEKEISERANEPDTMSKLGEWGQDAREGEMTNFEKENPDVLLLSKDYTFLQNM